MRALRLASPSLLVGALLCLAVPVPAMAQTPTLQMVFPSDAPAGLVPPIGPARPVAVDVTAQSIGPKTTVECGRQPDVLLVHPSQFEISLGAASRIFVEIEPPNLGYGSDTILTVECRFTSITGDAATLDIPFEYIDSRIIPRVEVEESGSLRASVWWPISLHYGDNVPSKPLDQTFVEWLPLTGNVLLFNNESTGLDSRGSSFNMVEVVPNSPEASYVLARVNALDPVNDVSLILPLGSQILEGSQQKNFDLDPRFSSHDENGQRVAIKVRPGARGTLRMRARNEDDDPIDVGRAFWTANWATATMLPFASETNGGDTFSTTVVFPERQWAEQSGGEPPQLIAWAMENSSSGTPMIDSETIEVRFSEDLPSLYGCTQGGGGGSNLALALLLGLLLLGRGRSARALALLLLGASLLSPGPAAAEDDEAGPRKLGLAYTGVIAPPNANPDEVKAISEYLQTELIARGAYQVVGPGEIQALMGLEAQKQLLGCNESSAACLAEVGGALGSDRLLSGNVTRVGQSVILSLSLLDVQSARLIHRAGERVKVGDSLEPLLDVVPRLIDEVISRDERALAAAPPTSVPSPAGARDAATPGPRAPTAVATTAPAGSSPTPHPIADPPRPEGALEPPAPAAEAPHPLAAAHRGAGTFLLQAHNELALPFPGYVFGLGLRWRRGLAGASISLLGHPAEPLARPERAVGVRLEGRLYPRDFGRAAPFLGVGLSAMVPSLLVRLALGAEIAVGGVRFTPMVALELLTNDLSFFASVNPLLGLGVGYAF